MARLAKNTENAIGIFFCQTGISRTVSYQLLSACDLKKKKKMSHISLKSADDFLILTKVEHVSLWSDRDG